MSDIRRTWSPVAEELGDVLMLLKTWGGSSFLSHRWWSLFQTKRKVWCSKEKLSIAVALPTSLLKTHKETTKRQKTTTKRDKPTTKRQKTTKKKTETDHKETKNHLKERQTTTKRHKPTTKRQKTTSKRQKPPQRDRHNMQPSSSSLLLSPSVGRLLEESLVSETGYHQRCSDSVSRCSGHQHTDHLSS